MGFWLVSLYFELVDLKKEFLVIVLVVVMLELFFLVFVIKIFCVLNLLIFINILILREKKD